MAISWGTGTVMIRSIFALLAGVLIGIERGLKRRSAGVKTHALVCLGSALVMMTSEYMNVHFQVDTDLSRMGAQVISGVGFLGVGTIMVTGQNKVKGLTTAAGLWTCACVGLAIGIGFLEGAIVALVLIWITLNILTKMDTWMLKYAKIYDLYIEFESSKGIGSFLREMRHDGIKITTFEVSKGKIKGEGPNAVVCLEIDKKVKTSEVLEKIKTLEYVRYLEVL
ncbi:MAG: MgtC/SapB family protein [Eubacteriales bacterium]